MYGLVPQPIGVIIIETVPSRLRTRKLIGYYIKLDFFAGIT
jgi:hypothetical protein